jgi:HD-GYP domain-containing protein (c-di-GMP phosphodiesterase class II)
MVHNMSKSELQLKGLSTEVKDRKFSVSNDFIIGRSPQCDLFITDLQASRRHTRFFRDKAGTLMVEDLNSSNGTFYNGAQIKEPKVVRVGDVIRLGGTEFTVEFPKVAAATIVSGGFSTTHFKRSATDILGEMESGKAHNLETLETSNNLGFRKELEKKNRQFRALYEMSRIVQEHADPEEMIAFALKKLLVVLGGDNAYLLMVESGGSLCLRSSQNAAGKDVSDFRISKTLTHHVIDEKCAVVAPDLLNDQRFSSSKSIIMSASRSILAVPIIFGNIAKGMVALSGEEALDDSTQEDLELLCICVSIIGPALRNLDLSKEIEETQREVLYTMGSIGETRSKETGNHVKRVAEYSKLLGILYGLDEESAELLKQASPMHDIGKVGIPDRVLNKPGKLNDEEWKIMQTHARLGFDMLDHSTRPILKAAAIVAHEHHEKWNGRGYPRQLKGEAIHIYGRITAVADVFDALGSDRCYKKAWPLEKILGLFKRERGEHFDPKLVDLLFRNLPKFLSIRDAFVDVLNTEV